MLKTNAVIKIPNKVGGFIIIKKSNHKCENKADSKPQHVQKFMKEKKMFELLCKATDLSRRNVSPQQKHQSICYIRISFYYNNA
jgi:hypothetical protein